MEEQTMKSDGEMEKQECVICHYPKTVKKETAPDGTVHHYCPVCFADFYV